MTTTLDDLPRPSFTAPGAVSTTLHQHLRRLIVQNLLPGGATLKQAELARTFGVSRTPMREAFRMLQEEGLVYAVTNQRARVRGLDAEELDGLYGVRISLEVLGARITAGRLTPEEQEAGEDALVAMEEARDEDDQERWISAHRQFHLLCVSRVGEPMRRVITSHSERSERYVRMHQILDPHSYREAHADHVDILAALIAGDADSAARRLARHLSHTSLAVLQNVNADDPGIATRTALAIAEATPDLASTSEAAP
jgi:DNA-binding GntR family transcriptional regulator